MCNPISVTIRHDVITLWALYIYITVMQHLERLRLSLCVRERDGQRTTGLQTERRALRESEAHTERHAGGERERGSFCTCGRELD